MSSDNINTASSDGVRDGYQNLQLSHRRTNGPRRRSSKGQWTAEEDEILHKAVQRFQGKNWRKIAEYFKDRTDVQCLHRWQKVLNPELVKGPWSKEEDETMTELVHKYGAKKWSTIAQHLPGRIGKQCRERWHNHLNPTINKEAWTQEEEMALIHAHQIYGNKWAELSKFLPGRSDNAIKNHWNSSVKKKLEAYLASGLLVQFQGLSSIPLSSSRVMQITSGENGIEVEKIIECSQGSNVVGCLQSTSDLVHADADAREECRLTEESSHGKNPCSSPASCSEHYPVSLEEVAFSTPEVHYEFGDSSIIEHNFSHNWGTPAGKDCQHNFEDSPDISSQDLGQESSGLLMHSVGGNGTHDSVHFLLQTPERLSVYTSMGNMIAASDETECMLISEDSSCRGFSDRGNDRGNLMKCSNINSDGCTDSFLNQSSNCQLPEVSGTLVSQSYNSLRSEILVSSESQPFGDAPLLPDDAAPIFANDLNSFDVLSVDNQEEQPTTGSHDGFIYFNDTAGTSCSDGMDSSMDLQGKQDQAKDSTKLVPVNDFGSVPSNDKTCPSVDESAVVPTAQQDVGSLFYEPPHFPSLDIPFFSCDLVQCDREMQLEYSPLGIRQLMMPSLNCFTPCRLWGSPSRGGNSPDAMLKSAAKTFTRTPSILKKRHRDLLSPLPEKRSEKKFESDMNQESFSSLANDFSQLDVTFDDSTENQKASFHSLLSKQKRNSTITSKDKENLVYDFEVRKYDSGLFDKRNSENEFISTNSEETKEETSVADAQTKGSVASTIQTVQHPSGILQELDINDLVFFSPNRFEIKSERATSSNSKTPGNQHSKRLEATLNQGTHSEFSSTNSHLSVVTSTVCQKNDSNHLVAFTSIKSATKLTPLKITVENSGNNAGVDNFSIFGGTPFRRSFESPSAWKSPSTWKSPSAWKSPWFVNSFVPGPRVDTDITIEDIGYFMSPEDRSYDAIGLMKQWSEHTAAAFADAQEVLGNEILETEVNEKDYKNQKLEQENDHIADSQADNHDTVASNALKEWRVLDFSECGTPGKGTESGKLCTATSSSSPSAIF